MADADVMESIEKLAHEEHDLRERQCWDFLRQRRARLAAGLDPDEAKVRDVDTVENYRS